MCSLQINTEFIGRKRYLLFSTSDLNKAELRGNEFTEDGKKILLLCYGYFAGKSDDSSLIVDHIRRLLVRVSLKYQNDGEFYEIRLTREPYRLPGTERSCICEEYADQLFVVDEYWNSKVSRKVEKKLYTFLQLPSCPFKPNTEGDASLVEYYVRYLHEDPIVTTVASDCITATFATTTTVRPNAVADLRAEFSRVSRTQCSLGSKSVQRSDRLITTQSQRPSRSVTAAQDGTPLLKRARSSTKVVSILTPN
jgi:hypothetical protein